MYVEQMMNDYRQLHAHPELSGKEEETSAWIRSRLQALGIEVKPYAPMSVVGWIPGKTGERTIALRADIDALPIQEEADVPYRSTVDGVAHLCGHDGHTAVLLAVATWLVNENIEHDANILLLFQSAEEISPSGADALCRAGVMDGVDEVYGLHLWQGLPLGTIGTSEGPLMASIDDFDITVYGKGGHGAEPEATIDPVVVASQIVQSFQSIVSRTLSPLDAGVVTVGSIQAGEAFNVIPDTARLIGTMRGLSYEAVETMKREVTKRAEGIAAAFGATADVTLIEGTPPLVNDATCASYAIEAAQRVEGTTFELVRPSMGGEDFSFYLKETKGAYVWIGMASDVSAHPHHHPKFRIDPRAFPYAFDYCQQLIQLRA